MNRLIGFSWLVVLFCLLAAGCGAGGAKVKGRLAVNGQPYTLVAGEELQIGFVSKTMSLAVSPNADGTFTITGPGGSGLPPDTYQIRLASFGAANKEYKDKFAGALSGNQSWLQYELTSEPEQKIVVDLGTKTVVKEAVGKE